MVLGGSHQLVMGSVHKCEHGHFAAGHELLDDNAVSGVAEFFIHHQLADTVFCRGQILTDQDALAQSKSGSFQDDGEGGCLEIGQRLVRVLEGFISGCGDPVFFHQILGKSLAALDDRRIGRRAEDAQSLCLKSIHDTGAERIIHTADCKVDLFFPGEGSQCRKIHRSDRNTLGNTRNTGVTGRAIQLCHTAAAQDRVRDRVLSSAAANKKYLHVHFLLSQVFILLRKNCFPVAVSVLITRARIMP